jgi:pentose-5-phosphate-3-epimerase
MKILVPAIIPQSLSHLNESLSSIAGIHEVHIDVVDGQFAGQPSWPIEPVGEVSDITTYIKSHSVEVDIMARNPLRYALPWIQNGVDMVVLHTETIDITAFENFVETTMITVGISALLDTPYETLKPYLALADYTQVIGIKTIGAQGQPFDERALARVNEIHKDFPHLLISIDGSMNRETIPKLQSVPVERVIVGSAIMKTDHRMQAYADLSALL